MNKKIAIIIPARLASTRLPNKPLVDILGKTMILRVHEKAVKANIGDVYVACDSQEIFDEITNNGGTAIMTDANLPSGTDRIHSAFQKISQNYDYIMNLQGDLPNIDPEVLKLSAKAAIDNENLDIVTAASITQDIEEINDPNIVKIALAKNDEKYGKNCGRALYFSRAPISYSKNHKDDYYHHIGIYIFRTEALEKFVSLPQSNLEKQESLEQLRALENDMSILVKIVDSNPLSVDTKEDLEKIIAEIKKNND